MSVRPKLQIVPVSLEEANFFVREHHRHHKPVPGHKFSLAVADDAGDIRGVAIVGRPVARMLDDGWTLEVNRAATDGCPNANSALYAAAWRAAKALGYRRLVTYTLPEESGASLRGAGWKCIGEAGGRFVGLSVAAAHRHTPAANEIAVGSVIPEFPRVQAACVNWILSWNLPELDDMAELLAHCEEMPPEEWRQRFGELVDLLPQEWSQTQVFRQIQDVMGDCLEWMSHNPATAPATHPGAILAPSPWGSIP